MLNDFLNEGGGGGAILTSEFMTFAAAAIREFGFVKKTDPHGRLSTDGRIWDAIYPQRKEDRLHPTDDDLRTALAALAWAEEQTGSDFATNMRIAAKQPTVNSRRSGILAFIPEGYRRSVATAAEKETRDAADNAAGVRSQPVPEGRTEHIGAVLKVDVRESDWGMVRKALIRCAGYDLWGTAPLIDQTGHYGRAEMGDVIRFTAAAEPKELGFGFYKRPGKAELLERPDKTDNPKEQT